MRFLFSSMSIDYFSTGKIACHNLEWHCNPVDRAHTFLNSHAGATTNILMWMLNDTPTGYKKPYSTNSNQHPKQNLCQMVIQQGYHCMKHIKIHTYYIFKAKVYGWTFSFSRCKVT
ncbi:hypothetical protein SAMN02910409_1171 [Prevotellaceae bacterium HUN156]|nr:hypothetical protein SAMN02910409_1171 [Prevotellaceae bacterium HUN156]